jgi:hypothetical protein
MTKDDDNLRFWYEHELCRLRAAERAGFNVTKEKDEMTRLLNATLTVTIHDYTGTGSHQCSNARGEKRCDTCFEEITAAVNPMVGEYTIDYSEPSQAQVDATNEMARKNRVLGDDDVLPTDWTKP